MAPPAAPPHERDWYKGLKAHLILVPAWTVAPALLLGGLIATGRPHGFKGIGASLAIGVGLVISNGASTRGPLALALLGVGGAAPAGTQRFVSLFAAGLCAGLAWMCKPTTSDFGKRPAVWSFISKWRADFYNQAELRGHLSDIKKDKSCFAFHPHGVLCAGFTINGCYNPSFKQHAGKVNWLCDYNLRYKNPFFRMLCDSVRQDDFGIDAADKKSFVRFMQQGENVSLLPGGFQDAVAYKYSKDVTVVKKRKGFIKYCLQFGYRLHPVYTFGECETYYAFTGLRKLRMKISEYNIPMVAFFGWPFFPLLPRPDSRILTYVGKPLALPHIPEPSVADIDKWHEKYLQALTELFKEFRAEAGYPQSELEIV